MGARPQGQGSLREDLRLHGQFRQRRRWRGAALPPEAGRRLAPRPTSCSASTPTSITEAKATGLFDASRHRHQTPSRFPATIPDDIFVPYDYGHFAVIYDTQTIKNPPKSLKELVEGDPSQKIVIEDPRTSTPGLGLLLWVKSVYGDKAPEAWAKLKDRILTVTPGWSEAYGLFTKGEAPMVLSYTTSPAYHMVAENTERYQAAAFSEGHYIQIEVAGLLKNAPDQELAARLPEVHGHAGFPGHHPDQQLDDAGLRHIDAAAGCLRQAGASRQRPS